MTMKALKMPKVLNEGKGAVALSSRHKAVVAVVVSIALAARLYVHVNRVAIDPEMLGGITADSFYVSLTYLPRVREYKDVIRTDAEDQEEAEQLEDAHGFLEV
eukprot:scaffold163_cov69-Phaeocystis_antarctica.AAC.4